MCAVKDVDLFLEGLFLFWCCVGWWGFVLEADAGVGAGLGWGGGVGGGLAGGGFRDRRRGGAGGRGAGSRGAGGGRGAGGCGGFGSGCDRWLGSLRGC